MTTNPKTLSALSAYWLSKHGVPLGIVGNAAHTSGYHLGRDRIYDGSGPGLGDADYSVKMARDKAGLTNAASAIDLGRLNQSLGSLYAFSRWLVRQCQAGAVGSKDIREIIYSPDGAIVQRYSGVDNEIHTGPGNGDSSHLTHTHISYYRDSETRDKVALFAPYFASGGDTVGLTINLAVTHDTNPYDALGTAKVNAATTATKVADASKVSVAAGLGLGVVQKGTMGTTAIVAFNYAGEMAILPLAAVTFTPLTAPVTDCTPAIDAALAPVQATLATITAQLATAKTALTQAPGKERERIAERIGLAEAARIRGI